eukprot:gene15053-16606_t
MSELTHNIYDEFKDLTREQIKKYESAFNEYDLNGDHYIDQTELQTIMEKIGVPQTYLGLQNMLKQVDEDLDGKLSLREFLLIFRKFKEGLLEESSGLYKLATYINLVY